MQIDPIADFLNQLKNASTRKHDTVAVSSSKMKVELLKVLEHAGMIMGFETLTKGKFPKLSVKLKPETRLALRRMSKPGRRLYVSNDEIKTVRSGLGIQILSTPKGVMTNKQARAQGVGGEVICEAYVM